MLIHMNSSEVENLIEEQQIGKHNMIPCFISMIIINEKKKKTIE